MMPSAPLPEQRAYAARGAAVAMWRDRSPEVVLEGPAGTGKSRAVLEKLHWCAQKYPKMRGLLVRKTRESMTESVLVTWEEKVIPAGSPIVAGPARSGRQAYHYPNGSTVVVAGLVANGHDQKAKVMSTEYDMIVVPEATELIEHEWEQLTTRLRNGMMPYQQILGECNPDAPSHWLHQRCDRGTAAVYFSRHEDNPTLYRRDGTPTDAGVVYLDRLDRLTGPRRDRLRFGRRAAAEGLVYEEYDPAVHQIDPFPIPSSWPRIRSIDFGFTNPFVCQWWAMDGDGRLYRYRELYMSKRTVAAHLATIRQAEHWGTPEHERIMLSVADHDAEDRATLHQGGIMTMPAYKSVSTGIQAVQERFRIAGDGRPRLYLLRNSLIERDTEMDAHGKPWATEQELDSYRWPIAQNGKPSKEEPVKADDHGVDALRYLVAQIDLRGGIGGGLFR